MFCSYEDSLCNNSFGHKFFGVFFCQRGAWETAKNMTENLCGRDGGALAVGIRYLSFLMGACWYG